jgi:hypothetical protein
MLLVPLLRGPGTISPGFLTGHCVRKRHQR